jgi:hypothetical protein
MAPHFFKRKPASTRSDPADREKSVGAREYRARVHDRQADRFDAEGNAEGAQVERDAAEAARRVPPRRA